jgi:hypothetical protein
VEHGQPPPGDAVGVIKTPGGWFEFPGEEPPGRWFTSPDEGGDPETVRQLLGLVDDAEVERRGES